MAVVPILDPFWSPFGTPRPKNVGNQLLEVSGNSLNELSWSENGVVEQKINIPTLLVLKILPFNQFWSILGPFWTPGGTNFGENSDFFFCDYSKFTLTHCSYMKTWLHTSNLMKLGCK